MLGLDKALAWPGKEEGIMVPIVPSKELKIDIDKLVDEASTVGAKRFAAVVVGDDAAGRNAVAHQIADALSRNLSAVDLSAVVSKYIGETEKNLRRLFKAAEESGAILYFEEADALFGKRSDVSDSHDRYANLEVSYLLQRIEEHKGLLILATNKKDNVPPALERHVRYVFIRQPVSQDSQK